LNGGDIITTFAFPGIQISLIAGYEAAKDKLADKNIIALKGRLINAAGRMKAIFFDKTGTLTINEMKLDSVIISQTQSNKLAMVEFALEAEVDMELSSEERARESLIMQNFATNQTLTSLDGKVLGDPMEDEMFKFSGGQFSREEEGKEVDGVKFVRQILFKPSQVHSHPPSLHVMHVFDFKSHLQRMSVLVQDTHSKKNYVFTKGAPEKIMKQCRPESVPGDAQEEVKRLSKQGFRVLAFGMKEIADDFKEVATAHLDTGQRRV